MTISSAIRRSLPWLALAAASLLLCWFAAGWIWALALPAAPPTPAVPAITLGQAQVADLSRPGHAAVQYRPARR